MNKQKGIASVVVMVAMLVMAVALPITTKLVQQSQENRSKAANYYTVYVNGVCKSSSSTYASLSACNASPPKDNCYDSLALCKATTDPSGFCSGSCSSVGKTHTGECGSGYTESNCSNILDEACNTVWKTKLTCCTCTKKITTPTCPQKLRYYFDKTSQSCKSALASGICDTSNCGGDYTCYEKEKDCTDVYGKCGSAAGHDASSVPTVDSLCSTGSPSSVVDKSTFYQWSCVGSGGSSSAALCNASKTTTTTCTANETKCLGTQPQVCNSTGTAWVNNGNDCGTSGCNSTTKLCNTTTACDSIPSTCNGKNFLNYKGEGDFNCSDGVDIIDFNLWKGWYNAGKENCGAIADFTNWKTAFNKSN